MQLTFSLCYMNQQLHKTHKPADVHNIDCLIICALDLLMGMRQDVRVKLRRHRQAQWRALLDWGLCFILEETCVELFSFSVQRNTCAGKIAF